MSGAADKENTEPDLNEIKRLIVQSCSTSGSILSAMRVLSQHKSLIAENVSWIDSSGDTQTTPPLFIAIDYHHVDSVDELLSLYTSEMLNGSLVGGDGEYTALQWASFMGNLQIVKLLVEKGGAIADEESLSLAREENHSNAVEYLERHVNHYADLEHLYGSESDGDADSVYMGRMSNNNVVVEEDSIADTTKEEQDVVPTPTISGNSNSGNNTLTFSIPTQSEDEDDLQIKLHQATTSDENQGHAQTNTGFIMWPSAVMLSHHLTQNPNIVLGNETLVRGNVLELGSGCGLAGLTAATLLENDGSFDKVIFTDYNPSVLENLKRNVNLNDFDVDHKVFGLDWFDNQGQEQQVLSSESEGEEDDTTNASSNCRRHKKKKRSNSNNTWMDMNGTEHEQTRLIIGSDLIVCSNDADLVAGTIDKALMEGGQAIIVGADSSHRFGVSGFPDACRELGLEVEVNENIWEEVSCCSDELQEELELGGYNQRAATLGTDCEY